MMMMWVSHKNQSTLASHFKWLPKRMKLYLADQMSTINPKWGRDCSFNCHIVLVTFCMSRRNGSRRNGTNSLGRQPDQQPETTPLLERWQVHLMKILTTKVPTKVNMHWTCYTNHDERSYTIRFSDQGLGSRCVLKWRQQTSALTF